MPTNDTPTLGSAPFVVRLATTLGDLASGGIDAMQFQQLLDRIGDLIAALGSGSGGSGGTGDKGPDGDKGPPGDQGAPGVQGLRGVQGLPGDKGAPGDKGLKGDPGVQGMPGIPGITLMRDGVPVSVSALNFVGSTFANGVLTLTAGSGGTTAPTPPPPPAEEVETWTKVADENSSFTLSKLTTIRFGNAARGEFETKDLAAGTYGCGEGTFGRDPSSGFAKTCEASSIAAVPYIPPADGPNGGETSRTDQRVGYLRFPKDIDHSSLAMLFIDETGHTTASPLVLTFEQDGQSISIGAFVKLDEATPFGARGLWVGSEFEWTPTSRVFYSYTKPAAGSPRLMFVDGTPVPSFRRQEVTNLLGDDGDAGGDLGGWIEPDTTTPVAASRMLHQAAFGANPDNVAEVQAKGLTGWVDEQLAMPLPGGSTYFKDYRERMAIEDPGYSIPNVFRVIHPRWHYGADKLRSRMMFALSEIFVVSQANSAEFQDYNGLGSYTDILYTHALGNHRDLLEAVAHSGAMAIFLTYIHNEGRPENPLQQADENFARELLQLFTIGKWELNLDGSRKTYATLPTNDPRYNPDSTAEVPTYGQFEIRDCAKVWTGWTYGYPAQYASFVEYRRAMPAGGANTKIRDLAYQMWDFPFIDDDYTKGRRWYDKGIFFGGHHNLDAKTNLIGGLTLPAYTGPRDFQGEDDTAGPSYAAADVYARNEVKLLLDAIHNHPNCGPFLALRLIQFFTKSNPTPAYIARVATVFNDNGQGVRGDLKATLRAVLLDIEARDESLMSEPTAGKFREPVLNYFQACTAFRVRSLGVHRMADCDYLGLDYLSSLKQDIFSASSVFGFGPPDYRDPQLLAGLVSPEAKMLQETSTISLANEPLGRSNWFRTLEQFEADTSSDASWSVIDVPGEGADWIYRYCGRNPSPDGNQTMRDTTGAIVTPEQVRERLTNLVADLNLYLCAGQVNAAFLAQVIDEAYPMFSNGFKFGGYLYDYFLPNLMSAIIRHPNRMVIK